MATVDIHLRLSILLLSLALGTAVYAEPTLTADCEVEAKADSDEDKQDSGFSLVFGGITLNRPRDAGPQRDCQAGADCPDGERGGGGVGAGVSINLTELLRSLAQPDLATVLLKSGPEFESLYNMSCMPVRGFVKGQWPLVIDYQTQGDSRIRLEVHLEDESDPFISELNAAPGRHYEQLTLPDWMGNEPRPALLLIRAVREQAGESIPGQVQLFGLGAGPAAVGSVAIDNVVFQPAQVRPALGETAAYSFHSRSDFNRFSVEVMQLRTTDANTIEVRLVRGFDEQGGVERDAWIGHPEPRNWDGLDNEQRVSVGSHLLQVRAWLTAREQGDWVSAWSSDSVQIVE